MPKPRNKKAALKKKNKKKGKAKAKAKPKAEEKSTTDHVLDSIDDPDHAQKEFCRDINIHNFSLDPIGGGPRLIVKAEIKLTHGHRYGLIGYNGTGKTTFLKELSSGRIKEIPSYLRILCVQQEMDGTDLTVMETVLKSDKERFVLIAEQKRVTQELALLHTMDEELKEKEKLEKENDNLPVISKKNKKKHLSKQQIDELGIKYTLQLQKVVDRLKFIEADTAEARASHVLNGLNFTDKMKNMPTSDLSGGWRMRVSLACALFVCPDILLLDEPTNHLDFPSVIWLSEYLAYEYPDDKTVIIVSHDRRFLNDVCTDIMHLENYRIKYYKGNYEAFRRIRSDMRIHQKKQYERQQKMIKHNTEFIAKFKANKKWSTQAQSRAKLLTRVNKIEKVLGDLEFRFHFPVPDKPKNDLLFHFDDVTFGYYGELKGKDISSYILRKINLRVKFGEKIGVLGANGAGKSTLIKLIMKEVHPIHGTAHLANSASVGYFGQHHLDTLDFNKTPLEHLKSTFGSGTTQQQIYAQLGRFNLGDKFARRKIGTLSGGQKSRVAFSILTWYNPHIIIMDEPTNHLDMPTIDALAIALSDFDGTIFIVSHDQHFVETCCDEYWCVGQRTIKMFDDFNKCRDYSKKCKAPNILPRKFSTVNHKRSINLDVNTETKFTNKSTDKLIEQKKKVKPKINKAEVFKIDPERVVNKGLEKGLTPNGILVHLKGGWKPTDGDFGIVTKLGFIMFLDWFNEKNMDYTEMDHEEYYLLWKNIINYCIPLNFQKNQLQLIEIAMRNFVTAKKDNNKSRRVNTPYSFGLILESMIREHNMISIDYLKEFRESKKNSNKLNEIQKDVLQQMDNFILMAEQDNNDDSDSESE